jgi:hypothetical protein
LRADPADLDVDDPAATHLQGRPGRVERQDAFVEAERRRHLPLQLGVVPEVVGSEGLFDHEQVVGIESLERLHISQAVGAVGVGLEHDVRIFLADGGASGGVPARLDLELDPLIALIEVPPDPGDEVRE